MTRAEFQALHGFDDQEMDRLAQFRATFGAKMPSVVINQDEGRWVFEVKKEPKRG